jgi:hypothetical protein
MALKERISSPLEAGVSILDGYHLPSHVHAALEFASARLAKKSLHITLVVVRRDYQLPLNLGCSSGQTSAASTPPSSPPMNRLNFSAGPFSALKQLVRSHRQASFDTVSPLSSPASSPTPADGFVSKGQSPASPSMGNPTPPMTPSTLSSAPSSNLRRPMPGNSFGMRLVYATNETVKVKKALDEVLARAERRFGVGKEWLASATDPADCGFSEQLIRNSVAQNQVLYYSEGLTLVSLDRLYSVKSALASYNRTKSGMHLEDAVDELRRYILANDGRKIVRTDLMRSYDWLGVNNATILELDRMYRRAYGGMDQSGGVAGISAHSSPILSQDPKIRSDDDDDNTETQAQEEKVAAKDASPMLQQPKSPALKGPLLRLQTSFDKPKAKHEEPSSKDERGQDKCSPGLTPVVKFQPWNPFSIDEILGSDIQSPGGDLAGRLSSPIHAAMAQGPLTPNHDDDISPITRGEWGFLMVDNNAGRIAAVETC